MVSKKMNPLKSCEGEVEKSVPGDQHYTSWCQLVIIGTDIFSHFDTYDTIL